MKRNIGSFEWLAPADAYDQWAGEYDDADPSTLLDEPFLLAMVKIFPGCRLLDLGCGTGRYVRILNRPGISIVGVDLSQGMLARARRTCLSKSTVAWVQASFTKLPFIGGTFDRVISGLVLDHVENLHSYFHQIATMLRPGGRLILSTVHPDMQRLTGSNVRFTVQGRHYQTEGTVHEVYSIANAVRQVGLTVESLLEPSVDQNMVAHRPVWKTRLGCPALVLLAAQKGEVSNCSQ
ncbi:Methyltransf_11 domain-containing protein [Nitrospira tepida]|uniref:Methyltransf_11 domain-containing protein n=1 Tax=Nitrospira tepida TaxID=2973512 RepID=A0AA86N112_9BACT|nr:class I SAM-dependent methyltransferase [Nitrospira tepida]CAI4032783.1 Methyltransf_11 domain-containing protein [Nitrospira tepida]